MGFPTSFRFSIITSLEPVQSNCKLLDKIKANSCPFLCVSVKTLLNLKVIWIVVIPWWEGWASRKTMKILVMIRGILDTWCILSQFISTSFSYLISLNLILNLHARADPVTTFVRGSHLKQSLGKQLRTHICVKESPFCGFWSDLICYILMLKFCLFFLERKLLFVSSLEFHYWEKKLSSLCASLLSGFAVIKDAHPTKRVQESIWLLEGS